MNVDDDLKALAALERRLEALASEVPPAHSSGPAKASVPSLAPEKWAALRGRLLAAIGEVGRFERFVPTVAALADVSEATARGWLDAVWGETPRWEDAAPGARTWWVEGGPKAHNALRGFVHVATCRTFPHHTHLGDEHVLVLQGGARLSTGERLYAGEQMTTSPGVEHAFEAGPGPDLLVFTVAYEGLDFGRFVARPRATR